MGITYDRNAIIAKANKYCDINELSIVRQLGFGTQGIVLQTNRDSALKIHNLADGYVRERNVYLRLLERKITSIQGLMIPRIMHWEDELFILEMSIVHVPCILDFGGCYLDIPPPHMVRDQDWISSKSDEFGDNWHNVQSVIREIEFRADIWLADVNSNNIKFE